MSNTRSSDAAKAVVRRNTEEVQGNGNFEVFEELFADELRSGPAFDTAVKSRRPDSETLGVVSEFAYWPACSRHLGCVL